MVISPHENVRLRRTWAMSPMLPVGEVRVVREPFLKMLAISSKRPRMSEKFNSSRLLLLESAMGLQHEEGMTAKCNDDDEDDDVVEWQQ